MRKLMYLLFMSLMGGLTGLLVCLVTWYAVGLLTSNETIQCIAAVATYPLSFYFGHKEAKYFASFFI